MTALIGLAGLLAKHWPHPVFGCECMPADPKTGMTEPLSSSWEEHLEAVVMAWLRDSNALRAAIDGAAHTTGHGRDEVTG